MNSDTQNIKTILEDRLEEVEEDIDVRLAKPGYTTWSYGLSKKAGKSLRSEYKETKKYVEALVEELRTLPKDEPSSLARSKEIVNLVEARMDRHVEVFKTITTPYVRQEESSSENVELYAGCSPKSSSTEEESKKPSSYDNGNDNSSGPDKGDGTNNGGDNPSGSAPTSGSGPDPASTSDNGPDASSASSAKSLFATYLSFFSHRNS